MTLPVQNINLLTGRHNLLITSLNLLMINFYKDGFLASFKQPFFLLKITQIYLKGSGTCILQWIQLFQVLVMHEGVFIGISSEQRNIYIYIFFLSDLVCSPQKKRLYLLNPNSSRKKKPFFSLLLLSTRKHFFRFIDMGE